MSVQTLDDEQNALYKGQMEKIGGEDKGLVLGTEGADERQQPGM